MFEVPRGLKSANISRSMRFTDDLFERLNEVAAQNDISFNALVLYCCQYALDNMKEEE